ncbi:MAG: class I SAM-dependent methyltransferase [Sandaracinus sp.]
MSASDVRAYYDDFSHHYDRGRDRGYHAMIDEIEAGAVIELAHGREVLEVGCGTGLVLERVARVAARAEGVDLSPGMLAHARGRGLSVREGDATALPFADASFDVVYAFKVLAHVPDIERAIAEMFRVVRPGGHVLVEVYNRRSLRFVSRAIGGARRIGNAHDESDVPTRWETLEQATARLPRHARVERLVGARILTPVATVHRVPILGGLLRRAEHAVSRGPLARYAGFAILVARRLG